MDSGRTRHRPLHLCAVAKARNADSAVAVTAFYGRNGLADIATAQPSIRGFILGCCCCRSCCCRSVCSPLLFLMDGRVVQLKRLAQFRVAISLFGKTQVGHSQVLKILAIAFVLLCLGEHIGRSKAICISRPHYWLSSNVPDLITNHDAPQSFRVLACKSRNRRNRYGGALRAPRSARIGRHAYHPGADPSKGGGDKCRPTGTNLLRSATRSTAAPTDLGSKPKKPTTRALPVWQCTEPSMATRSRETL